ncbi:heterokaryon incompatibility protein-domain-containing protein [Cadophora sp. MPI-SDFR-AT-0126]|nr:heterokaryon incompatibility protein-domain-containing protein [Leotiomycetes sp. MPI-SDFR-AT-0126]
MNEKINRLLQQLLLKADDRVIYKALDASKREIRVLHILPSQQDDATVKCVLRSLWADAICINQNDEQERTSQVRLMGTIYSQTSLAISWLGADAAAQLQDGIRLMMLIHNEVECDTSRDNKWLDKYPLLFQDDKDSAHLDRFWSSTRAFLNLEYWKRKWIIPRDCTSKWLGIHCREKYNPI